MNRDNDPCACGHMRVFHHPRLHLCQYEGTGQRCPCPEFREKVSEFTAEDSAHRAGKRRVAPEQPGELEVQIGRLCAPHGLDPLSFTRWDDSGWRVVYQGQTRSGTRLVDAVRAMADAVETARDHADGHDAGEWAMGMQSEAERGAVTMNIIDWSVDGHPSDDQVREQANALHGRVLARLGLARSEPMGPRRKWDPDGPVKPDTTEMDAETEAREALAFRRRHAVLHPMVARHADVPALRGLGSEGAALAEEFIQAVNDGTIDQLLAMGKGDI